MDNQDDPNNSLQETIGLHLSKVRFVMDYVEFHFGNLVFTSYCTLQLRVEGKKYENARLTAKDSMVSLLENKVVDALVYPDVQIIVRFDNGAELIVVFDEDPAENAMLYWLDSGNVDVW